MTANIVGQACTDDTSCGMTGERCLVGFEQLGNNADDGAQFNGGYCTTADACATDAECGDGAACLQVEGVGTCLQTCTAPTDCRGGYTCRPAPNNANTTEFCLPEVIDPCVDNAAWAMAGQCVLTYEIADDGATFAISGTGPGDDTFNVGPGTIVLRVPSTSGSAGLEPTDGAVGVLCQETHQNFVNTLGIQTVTQGFAVSTDSTTLNSGTLAAGVITWDTCTYGGNYPDGWSPADSASGPGCLGGYRSVGDVICEPDSPILCQLGSLDFGHNIQDGTWNQPLHSFELSDDFSTLTMGVLGAPAEVGSNVGVELPNDSPGRTHLGFTATLVDTSCQ